MLVTVRMLKQSYEDVDKNTAETGIPRCLYFTIYLKPKKSTTTTTNNYYYYKYCCWLQYILQYIICEQRNF